MNQKIENLLQVSLQATDLERERSPELASGYDPSQKQWELILKYAKDVEFLQKKYETARFRSLRNQYVIAKASFLDIEKIAAEPYVEWIEKPKRLFFELEQGKREACIMPLQRPTVSTGNLYGAGTLVAVIDSGIDLEQAEFRNPDGSSRIAALWDQVQQVEVSRQEIDTLLKNPGTDHRKRSLPGRDLSGHGTRVATIACGNHGVAPKAELIVVKLGMAEERSFPRTTQLMEAIDYVVDQAVRLQKPVAVNLSFGNNYGDHAGTTLLERYINDSTMNWKCSFCIGSGNEGLGATHASGVLRSYDSQVVEFGISNYETAVNLQIWKEYWDELEITLITPAGRTVGIAGRKGELQRVKEGENLVLMLYGEPSPYSSKQEIYLDLIPQDLYLTTGIWKLVIRSKAVKSGRYDIWMPGQAALNQGTGFLEPDSNRSCTIPGTAQRAITVGAYDARIDAVAPFSGRGEAAMDTGDISRYGSQNLAPGEGLAKPDLVAPGVEVYLSETDVCTGTSFATPFVTGGVALMMEWGIVQGNDPYLWGEKVKAYLIKGAKQLPGEAAYSVRTGWGALCVGESLQDRRA